MAGTGEAGAGTADDFKMYDLNRSNEDYPDQSMDSQAMMLMSVKKTKELENLKKKCSMSDQLSFSTQVTKDSLSSEGRFLHILNFKDFKGFK